VRSVESVAWCWFGVGLALQQQVSIANRDHEGRVHFVAETSTSQPRPRCFAALSDERTSLVGRMILQAIIRAPSFENRAVLPAYCPRDAPTSFWLMSFAISWCARTVSSVFAAQALTSGSMDIVDAR
jgi:hypothetical protein